VAKTTNRKTGDFDHVGMVNLEDLGFIRLKRTFAENSRFAVAALTISRLVKID
jgi:hypothetical protein